MPSVWPSMSRPMKNSGAQPTHLPARRNLSASTTRRAVASISVMAWVAVASSSTPGVLVRMTPRAVAAATSKLLKPTAKLGNDPALRSGGIEEFAVDGVSEH